MHQQIRSWERKMHQQILLAELLSSFSLPTATTNSTHRDQPSPFSLTPPRRWSSEDGTRRTRGGPQRTEPRTAHTVDERHRCWPWEEKDLGVEGCDLFSDLGGGLLRFGQRPDRSWQRGREEKKDRFAGLRFEKRPDRFGREERD